MVNHNSDADGQAATRCKPIFVIGHYRSGTTWLANLLEAHPNVYTPTHPEHHGQCESGFFSSLLPYCLWGRTAQDRVAMRAIFECSDYWHLLFPDDPPEVDASTQAPDAYFRECMDLAARRRGCSHWVEKTPTHTLLLGYLINAYPDAFFVAVDRNRTDVIRSYMFNSANPRSTSGWATTAMMIEVFRKVITKYQSSVISVHYEELRDKPEETLRNLYNALSLEAPSSIESSWPANSSFKGPPERVPQYLRLIAVVVSVLFRMVPSAWCERIGLRSFQNPDNKTLPGWFFRVFNGRNGGRAA